MASLLDGTLNRGPIYQCFTRECKRTHKKSRIVHQRSSVSVSLSLGRPTSLHCAETDARYFFKTNNNAIMSCFFESDQIILPFKFASKMFIICMI